MPFTQNDHYLQASTEKWLSRYKDERAGKGKRGSSGEEPAGKRRKLDGVQPSASASTSRVAEACKFGFLYCTYCALIGIPAVKFSSATPPSESAFEFGKPSFGAAPPDPSRSFPSGLHASKLQAERSASPGPPTPSNAVMVTDTEKINNVLAQLAELGYPGVSPDDFGKLRQVDEFETEITVMSEVRGYFQVRHSSNPVRV